MTFVSDIAQQVLSCFDTSLQEEDTPPGQICLRVGQVPYSAGLSEDLCCSGLAWVRVLRIYPSVAFPTADTNPVDCQTSSYAIELELGAVRCLPFGNNNAGPTCDQWTAVFFQVDEDAAAMRQAICCMRNLMDSGATFADQIVIGDWTPIDGDGGCIGGTQQISIQASCNECEA